ncbi:MAG: hypothetical protein JNL82_35740 [Myxococcales bacterium]|nr:hypothetical protein [Myxococcales bacterium]
MIAEAVVYLTLLATPVAPDLPPDAREHNDRGIGLVNSGQVEAGVAELERAYASMPDPVQYRAGRGKVVGSLRSALMRHYDATRASEHLCRLRKILHRHRTELLAALGPAGGPADVAGTDGVIREVDGLLAGRPCEAHAVIVPAPAPPPAAASPPPAPARPGPPRSAAAGASVASPPPPLHPPGERRDRRMRVTGGVLLGVGGLSAIGAAIAGALYAERYRRLDALDPDRLLDDSAELAEWGRLYHGGRHARTAAVVTGSAAGALLIAGVAVLARRPGRAGRASLAPTIGSHGWGLHLSGRF